MAPPTLLTPLPPGAPPPPMPRPSAAALAAYRPDVHVLAPLPQYAPLPEIVRAPPPPPCKFCRAGRLPQRLGLPLRASGGGAGPSYAPPPQYAPMPPAPPRPTYAPAPMAPPRPPRPPPPQKFSNDGSFLEAMKRKLAAAAPAPAEEASRRAAAGEAAEASAAAKARRMKKKAEAPPAAAPRGSGRTTPAALALSTLDEEEDDIAPIGYDGDGARRGEEVKPLWSAKAEAAALKEATRRARCALRRAEAPPAPAPTLVEQALDAARDASPLPAGALSSL